MKKLNQFRHLKRHEDSMTDKELDAAIEAIGITPKQFNAVSELHEILKNNPMKVRKLTEEMVSILLRPLTF